MSSFFSRGLGAASSPLWGFIWVSLCRALGAAWGCAEFPPPAEVGLGEAPRMERLFGVLLGLSGGEIEAERQKQPLRL